MEVSQQQQQYMIQSKSHYKSANVQFQNNTAQNFFIQPSKKESTQDTAYTIGGGGGKYFDEHSYSRNTLPISLVNVENETTSKYEVVDKLIGNFREGKYIKAAYLRMIMMPEEIDKKQLKQRPYLGKLLKPGNIYEDQVKQHPSLTDKIVSIENVVTQKMKENLRKLDQDEAVDLNTQGFLNQEINDYAIATTGNTTIYNPFTIKGWLPKSVRDRKQSAQQAGSQLGSTLSIVDDDYTPDIVPNIHNLKYSSLSSHLNQNNPVYKRIFNKVESDDVEERKKVKKKSRFCLEESYLKKAIPNHQHHHHLITSSPVKHYSKEKQNKICNVYLEKKQAQSYMTMNNNMGNNHNDNYTLDSINQSNLSPKSLMTNNPRIMLIGESQMSRLQKEYNDSREELKISSQMDHIPQTLTSKTPSKPNLSINTQVIKIPLIINQLQPNQSKQSFSQLTPSNNNNNGSNLLQYQQLVNKELKFSELEQIQTKKGKLQHGSTFYKTTTNAMNMHVHQQPGAAPFNYDQRKSSLLPLILQNQKQIIGQSGRFSSLDRAMGMKNDKNGINLEKQKQKRNQFMNTLDNTNAIQNSNFKFKKNSLLMKSNAIGNLIGKDIPRGLFNYSQL